MKSIKWRIVVLFIVLVTIVMLINGTMIITLVKNDAYRRLYNDLGQTSDYLRETITDYKDFNLFKKEVKGTIKKYADAFKDKKYYIYDKNLQLIYPEDVDDSIKFPPMSVTAVSMGEESKELERIVLNTSTGTTETMLGYAEAVKNNDDIIYILYVEKPLKDIQDSLTSTMGTILLSVGIAIILFVILGLFFANSMTEPIIVLTKKALAIANGDLTKNVTPIQVKSDDEIGQLTESFNHMAVELHNTLSEMKSEKNKLETVFTHMADGILVFDTNGKLIHANPAAFQLMGVHMVGRDFNRIFSILEEKLTFSRLLTLEKNARKNYTVTIKDSFINLIFATYFDRLKKSVGLIAVLQDVTEHKKLEEMQKEFVANVSHELRTPLTTIKSYTETLIDGAMDDKDIATNFLGVINQESDRMTTLVQDLLELSRLDNKQIKFDFKEFNLNKLLEESVNKYRIHADKKEQMMTLTKIDEDIIIRADPNRIEQVINNILSNAVKYSQEKASIDIDLSRKGRRIQIKISDTGIGIPKEDLPRIFERFYRVDKARSRAMGGTGLGLAIAKEIMEHHGGELKVESEVGKGTKFYLIL